MGEGLRFNKMLTVKRSVDFGPDHVFASVYNIMRQYYKARGFNKQRHDCVKKEGGPKLFLMLFLRILAHFFRKNSKNFLKRLVNRFFKFLNMAKSTYLTGAA